MMDIIQARRWFERILAGEKIDMENFPQEFKDETMRKYWTIIDTAPNANMQNTIFLHGLSSGVLVALHEIFNFTPENINFDINEYENLLEWVKDEINKGDSGLFCKGSQLHRKIEELFEHKKRMEEIDNEENS